MAFLDLSGKVLAIISKRSFSQKEVLDYIEKFGEPVIIATDRKKPSRKIERIASAFDAYLFTPENDLRVKDKNLLLKERDMKHLNKHEKDALASAINAHKAFDDLFKRVDARLRKKGMTEKAGEVKSQIVKRKVHNIDKAIENL